jgi:hypothetical protein
VANLVNFLLSPRSGYITGESIAVSGMISLWWWKNDKVTWVQLVCQGRF